MLLAREPRIESISRICDRNTSNRRKSAAKSRKVVSAEIGRLARPPLGNRNHNRNPKSNRIGNRKHHIESNRRGRNEPCACCCSATTLRDRARQRPPRPPPLRHHCWQAGELHAAG
eukprot:7171647-Pyramimonas_sp.AAC.1